MLFLIFFLIIFLPGIFIRYFSASSNALGLIIAVTISLVILGVKLRCFFKLQSLKAIGFVFIFVITHFLLSYFLFDTDIEPTKSVSSILMLFFITMFSCLLAFYIKSVDGERLDITIKAITLIFILDGAASVLFNYLGYFTEKKMVFFDEPSHFAIAFSAFYFYSLIKVERKILLIITCLILGFFLQNLTFLLVLMFSTVALLGRKIKLLVICFLIFIPLILYIHTTSESLVYYSERLVISSDSQNLSVLVFISGFERAYEALFKSFFLGFGFQSMGYVGVLGESQNKINYILGSNLNLYDGGTLFAKIIFEFGFLGVVIGALYSSYFYSTYIYFHRYYLSLRNEPYNIFFICCLLMFSMSFFVRGVGYFSPSMLLFLTGTFGFFKRDTK